jgi:DNA (cytosine-5)-methyltransferase 1
MRPRLLDLFCGAGGAAMGYHRAGFEVVGVDINPQPRYPFEFHQADALTFPLDGFDAIHASPPCQAYSAQRVAWNARAYPRLIEPIRERLIDWGATWVIENVPQAPLLDPVRLCGSMFGLGALNQYLQRHRLFEANVTLGPPPPCVHRGDALGIYGDHLRLRRRGVGRRAREISKGKLAPASEAMGIDWMTWDELTESIPPAYTEWVGRRILAAVEVGLSA